MDAESMYTRAEAIFFEAAAITAGLERTRFLDTASGGDAALRAWVEDLLRYDGDLADEFDHAIQSVALAMASDVLPRDEDWLGRTLGAYRIKAKLGAGGMGSVFLGERADGRFQRQVAIKLVHPSMGEAVRLRLLEERRILARLEHPNIARLLDAGETPEGVPYLVMEYVDGVPIQRYCQDRKCGRRDVCQLMLQVCEAVAYAHRHQVIHRDLKPPNILVGDDGVPKLLDFGIAALLGTEPGEQAYTPRYASPEVLHGKPFNTSADVFSLGVLLRELLGTALDADLECVVAKATATPVEERYLTAEELAHELRCRQGKQ